MLCATHLNLGVSNPTQTIDKRRKVLGGHACIADKDRVTLQAISIGTDVVLNRLAASLFLAFNEHTYVEWQCAIDRHEGFQCLEYQHGLALVVAGPTAVDVVATDRWLKRGRIPQINRINRLHVVVSINKYRRLAACLEPIAIHERMTLCRDHLNVLKTDVFQLVSSVLRSTANITCMLR